MIGRETAGGLSSDSSATGISILRLVLGAIVGVLIAASAILVTQYDQSSRAGSLAAFRDDADGEAAAINGLFNAASRDLRLARQNAVFDVAGLASGSVIGGDERAQIDGALAYLGTRFEADEVCLIAADGREIARWDAITGIAAVRELSPDESAANPSFRQAMAAPDDGAVRSEPYVSPDTSRWVLGVATPLFLPNQQRAGVLHMEIPAARLAKVLAGTREKSRYLNLVAYGDANLVGDVATRDPWDPLADNRLDALPAWALAVSRSATDTRVSITGTTYRVASRAILDGDGFLLTAVAETALFGQVESAETILLIIVAPLVAILLLVAFLAVLRLGRLTRRLTDALRGAESRYRAIVDQTPAVTYIRRPGRAGDELEYISPQVETILGYTAEELIASPRIVDVIHPDDRVRVQRRRAEADATGAPLDFTFRMLHRDGRVVYVQDAAQLVTDVVAGGHSYWHGLMLDITERVEASAALEKSERQFRELVEAVPTVVYTSLPGINGAWTYVSPQIEHLLGFTAEEWSADPELWSAQIHPEDRERVLQDEIDAFAAARPPSLTDYRMLTKSGETRWVRDEMSATFGPDGVPLFWNGFLTDVTPQHELQDQLRHQAFHDALTGLPNRSLFSNRVEHTLKRWRRKRGCPAIIYLDLDKFKAVNDSLGHDAGDRVLVIAAARLIASVRQEDTPARLSGDEFAVLLDEVDDLDEALTIAGRIHKAFQMPFQIDGIDVFVTASIGVAEARNGERRVEDFLRRADAAMYVAKARSRDRVECYVPSMGTESRDRLALQSDLHHALERSEFRLVYQPITDLRRKTIMGYEALIRWEHPERGLLAPASFISIAEETGLILSIGRWVIREACQTAGKWSRLDTASEARSMTVNLSARQLADDELLRTVRDALAGAGLEPRNLILEITETVALARGRETLDRLNELRALGVRIAIDDFGTGYSSLSSLRGLPVDVLKIDKAFIDDIVGDEQARSIARSIVHMGRALGLRIVAEGIEERDQASALVAIGCELGQGYLFAQPLTEEAMLDYLTTADELAKAI